MSSPPSVPASAEVITLDDSREDNNEDDSVLNLTAMDTTITIDETLPPGVVSDSIVLLEEDTGTSYARMSSSDGNDDKDVHPIFKVVFRDISSFRNYRKKIENYLKDLIRPVCDKENIKSSLKDLVLEVYDSKSIHPHSSDISSKESLKEKQANVSKDSVKEKQIDVSSTDSVKENQATVSSEDSVKEKQANVSSKDLIKEKQANISSKNSLKEKQSNDALFTYDTEPKLQDDLDIPMYGKKFIKALQKSNNENIENKDDCGPKMTCFNCLGNHSLRDCSQPRNYLAISKNRKDYNAKRGPSSARYHLDDDQKFGHFIPGQLSSNLRKALNLKENELPRHIYRMRILGYPPGWLEEARLQHSGLCLFNSEGQAEEGSDEEGEIICPGDKDKYDVKKIIDFPGFNVLPPQGTRDECIQYWGSLVQKRYSKNAMLSFLSDKKADDGYKRRKLPNPNNMRVSTDVNPGEMDIDETEDTSVECLPVRNLFIPPLPKEEPSEPPPPPPPLPPLPPPPLPEDSDSQSQEDISINSNGESTGPSRDGSPSLFDLECAKKQLLAELDESSSHSNSDTVKTGVPKLDSSESENPNPDSSKTLASASESCKTEVPESDSSKTEAPELDSLKTEELDSSKTEESESNKTDVNGVTPKNSPKVQSVFGSGHKSVLAVHLGTPILHSLSPFRRLPNSEKFSKDICDVINFENLPDSTGKYDQMVDLLQKVRNTVSQLHKE